MVGGRPPLAPCGTPAADRRHQKAGESCDKCAGARALEQYLRRVINNPATTTEGRAHFETELAALLAGEWDEAMKQGRPRWQVSGYSRNVAYGPGLSLRRREYVDSYVSGRSPLAPCGTPARERRHQKAGETCEQCAGARALEQYLRRVINNPDTTAERRAHFETELTALLAGKWVETMKQDRPANR